MRTSDCTGLGIRAKGLRFTADGPSTLCHAPMRREDSKRDSSMKAPSPKFYVRDIRIRGSFQGGYRDTQGIKRDG